MIDGSIRVWRSLVGRRGMVCNHDLRRTCDRGFSATCMSKDYDAYDLVWHTRHEKTRHGTKDPCIMYARVWLGEDFW